MAEVNSSPVEGGGRGAPAPYRGDTPLVELIDVDVASAQDYSVVRVQGVNWSIGPRDWWVVGAGTGVGKRDLISTAAGLQRPVAGSVRMFGQDLSGLSEAELLQVRLRVALVFKWGGRMFENLTVSENVGLPLRYHRDLTLAQAEEPVQALLELTGLAEFAHNTAGMLTPQQQQRVGLARALALKPEVLFMDEPLTGLEPKEREWWLGFLAQLASGEALMENRPISVVVTARQVEPWLEHGRRFAIVKQGKWSVSNDRSELKSNVE